MAIVNVYLTFDGQCEEAFELYRSVFGGDYAMMSRFGEMPPDPEYPIEDAHQDLVMHVTLPQSDTFWDSYFGMCRDRFGVQWMVDYTAPRP